MAEAPAQIWLRQAWSDWVASQTLLDTADAATFCQAIGKQQQAVEKAVKAVLAALRTKKFVTASTSRRHEVDVEINHIYSAARRAASSRGARDLVQQIQALFNPKNAAEINALCALAPKWPGPGLLFPRNTEYPFELSPNVWTAPADLATFTASEMHRFRHIAARIVSGAGKIVSAVER